MPPHSTEAAPTACTAFFIHTHLARRLTPFLDSFVTVTAANTPQELIYRFDASFDAFQDALPPYFRLSPHTDTLFDSTHSYLVPHRIRLHVTLLSYRCGVHRAQLLKYLMPENPAGLRHMLAQHCLSSLRVQQSARMLDVKLVSRLFNHTTIFECAAILALILHVERSMAGGGPPSAEMTSYRGGVMAGYRTARLQYELSRGNVHGKSRPDTSRGHVEG